MLKIYSMTHYVSVDGKDWKEVGFDGGYCAKDETTEEVVAFENISFNECYKLLESHKFYGIKADRTIFFNRPEITVSYWPDAALYTHFNTISYKTVYKDANYLSLSDIMKILPVDQCIQYLKERGLSICPINI